MSAFDPRLQFLKDGLAAWEIQNHWKGPCGHSISELDNDCEYCTAVNEYLMWLDWLPEYNYGQRVGGQ
jgi:hypothetical protein